MVVMDKADHADGFGDALVAGGLPVAEVTFRTDEAEAAIRRLARRGDLLVGAGTVLTREQADRAIGAGAAFLVAPGTNPPVIDHCLLRSVPILPGVAVPTDIDLAMSFGIETMKFFPAENLGGTADAQGLLWAVCRRNLRPHRRHHARKAARPISSCPTCWPAAAPGWPRATRWPRATSRRSKRGSNRR